MWMANLYCWWCVSYCCISVSVELSRTCLHWCHNVGLYFHACYTMVHARTTFHPTLENAFRPSGILYKNVSLTITYKHCFFSVMALLKLKCHVQGSSEFHGYVSEIPVSLVHWECCFLDPFFGCSWVHYLELALRYIYVQFSGPEKEICLQMRIADSTNWYLAYN